MASSTLRCGHARCDRYFSQKLLPAVRTMSATSRVGRLIASCASRLLLSYRTGNDEGHRVYLDTSTPISVRTTKAKRLFLSGERGASADYGLRYQAKERY